VEPLFRSHILYQDSAPPEPSVFFWSVALQHIRSRCQLSRATGVARQPCLTLLPKQTSRVNVVEDNSSVGDKSRGSISENNRVSKLPLMLPRLLSPADDSLWKGSRFGLFSGVRRNCCLNERFFKDKGSLIDHPGIGPLSGRITGKRLGHEDRLYLP